MLYKFSKVNGLIVNVQIFKFKFERVWTSKNIHINVAQNFYSQNIRSSEYP
jgi:hypothetical protein